jgi:light-regulated signal transduction histidine kinase (bacteriophytochrome)
VIVADDDRFERENGDVHWICWEVRPWHTDDGAVGGIVIFTEDVTDRKRGEMEIRELNASLERRVTERTAELLAANKELDSFAYAVSHDLRAPLRAMNGFSQALAKTLGTTIQGDAKEFLDEIGIASRKMGELIDAILALSRITRGDLLRNAIDISMLATQALQDLAKSDPARKIEWHVEPGLHAIGDPRMIGALLSNLLGNAWKYTGKTANPCIRVFAGEIDGLQGICVSDNGAGFDPAHTSQLFKPFQRLHRQDELPGIGIGLATVQRIVHRHGGEIRAEAKPNNGASFCFSLPDHREEKSA